MLAVRLCGRRVIGRLESIGITRLEDLAPRYPCELVHQVNVARWQTHLASADGQIASVRDGAGE